MVKQFYSNHRWDLIRYYNSGSEWNWESWKWRDGSHSPKFQEWSLTIWMFNVISTTLFGVGGRFYPSAVMQCNLQSQPTGPKDSWVGWETDIMDRHHSTFPVTLSFTVYIYQVRRYDCLRNECGYRWHLFVRSINNFLKVQNFLYGWK